VVNESFLPNFLDIKTSNVRPWAQIPEDEMRKMISGFKSLSLELG